MHPRASNFLPDRGVIFHLGMLVKATLHQSNGYTPIPHAHPTAHQIVGRLSVDDKSAAQIDTRFPSRSRQPARGFGSPAAAPPRWLRSAIAWAARILFVEAILSYVNLSHASKRVTLVCP